MNFDIGGCEQTEFQIHSMILATASSPCPSYPSSVSVVYTTIPPPASWVKQLSDTLEEQTDAVPTVDKLDQLAVATETVYIFTPEMIAPFLDGIDQASFFQLRNMLVHARGVLWLSSGGSIDSRIPAFAQVSGLLRTLRQEGFGGCHRAHFLDELVRFLPDGVVQFRKRLDTYVDAGDDEKMVLSFADGSSARADVVVGCDGIRSRDRQTMFGKANPVSWPHYTHKVAFHGLIPMDRAVATLGPDKAMNQCMHMGPKAHVLNFPVAMNTMMNVVVFIDDTEDWPMDGKVGVMASREEVVDAFADWGSAVRDIVNLLPEELTKWGIFDMYDHPAPSYSQCRVCLAGDAAHASSPHHGAGAGFGVEDALVLATVLDQVIPTTRSSGVSTSLALQAALVAYSTIRLERTQWLVKSSRQVCDVYEWGLPGSGNDPEKCKQEIEWRAHRIWYFDIGKMLQDVVDEYRLQVEK